MAIKQFRLHRMATDMTLDEFKNWLKKFDDNNDGRISEEELRNATRSVGCWFSTWRSSRGIRKADFDGNKFVDDDELENLAAFAHRVLGIRIVP
ncbi:unnamed protein product [Spirodela intermedia]|uniref:EF-hand domain-containing protein n=1 Tax=Spirodela intermedia TaxID=51605 RepID=A0A7I8KX22_SPIIN|nr:unnamed protein product [Spirodela intermedia]